MTIFRKTLKGTQEIGARSRQLPMRLRQLLILVDGQRSDVDLVRMLPECDSLLAALVEGEFIEPVLSEGTRMAPHVAPGSRVQAAPPSAPATAAPAATAATAAPAPPAAPAAAPILSLTGAGFVSARSQAVRALIDTVGPMAEGLALKLERAATAKDLLPWLEHAELMVTQVRGADAAAAYARRVGLR